MTRKTKVFTNAIIFFFITASVYAAPVPDAAKLLPPDTAALLQVANFSELAEQFKKTSFYAFYKDPEMTAFVTKLRGQIQEKLVEDLQGTFRSIIDDKTFPQGRIAAAFVLNEKSLKAAEPMLFLMLDFGQNAVKAKALAAEQDKKAADAGRRVNKTTFQGIEIVTTIAAEGQRLDHGLASGFSYCFVEGTFIASEDIEVLKFAIAHLKGASSSTLADNADYNAALAATGAYHDIDLYVNIKHLITTFSDKDESGGTKQTLEKLGVDNVTSAALSIGVARQQGTTFLQKMCLKVGGTKKGIIKMLELDPQAVKAPPFLSSSVYSVMFLNISIRGIVEQLGTMFPMPLAALYSPLPSPDGGTPGPQIKADLIDHIGSQILIAQSINKSAPQDSMPIDTLFAVAVKNRTEVDKTLSFLHRTMLARGQEDSTRELLGHTIYLVNASFLPFLTPPTSTVQDSGPAQPQVPNVAFTVTDTHVLIASQTAVENAVRMLSEGRNESLTSTSWFNAAKANLPSLVGAASLQDNAAAVELLWNLVKKMDSSATSAAMGPAGLFMDTADLVEGIDFSLLPEFDKVRKYFGTSSGYGLSKPDGFYFESKN